MENRYFNATLTFAAGKRVKAEGGRRKAEGGRRKAEGLRSGTVVGCSTLIYF